MASKDNRIVYLDCLRIFACFAVLIQHATNLDLPVNRDWIINNTYHGLFTWAVPVFVMISGSLLIERNISIKDIYYKYIPRLLFYIFFWGFFYFLCFPEYQCWNGYGSTGLNKILAIFLSITSGVNYAHLWYLNMLLGLYIITPIVSVFCKNATKEQIEYSLVLLLIIKILVKYIPFNDAKEIFDSGIYYLEISFPNYLIYFVAGYFLKKYDIRKTERIILYISSILISIILVAYSNSQSYNRQNYVITTGYNYLGTFLSAIAIFTACKYSNDRLSKNKIFAFFCKYIPQYTFGIYLVHALVPIQLFNISDEVLILIPCRVAISFIISLLIVVLISKIPILKRTVMWN